MPDIEINTDGSSNIEIKLDNQIISSPEIDIETDSKIFESIETFPLYGPRGPKGEKGDKGDKGEKGDKGDTGAQGPQGEQGIRGIQGETGPQGIQGVQGEKGDKGDKGDTGAIGPQGPKGDTGLTGPQGPQGVQGEQGPQGIQGPKGETGATGTDGFSPTATVTKSGTVSTFIVTDKNGTTQTQILDGTGSITDVKVNNTSVVTSGVANIDLTGYAQSANLATVATSGSYNDLLNKPTIPSEVTESTVSGWGFTKNIGTVTSVNNTQPNANGNVTLPIPSTSDFEKTENKVTSITSSSTNTKYPSALAVLNILKTIYPVGCVYLTTNSTCPLSSLFGTWTLVSSGRALWTGTGSNGNTTIAAKLPNITGVANGVMWSTSTNKSGALTNNSTGKVSNASSTDGYRGVSFDASDSNTIYSSSATTVQPPAYVVNVFRRTA